MTSPKCQHCGYDLTGTRIHNEQYHCPECGQETRPWARDRFPPWWFGAIGLSIAAQIAVYVASGIYHGSLPLGSRTDTPGLLFGFPLIGPPAIAIFWFWHHRMVRRAFIWSMGVLMASFAASVATAILVGVLCMIAAGW